MSWLVCLVARLRCNPPAWVPIPCALRVPVLAFLKRKFFLHWKTCKALHLHSLCISLHLSLHLAASSSGKGSATSCNVASHVVLQKSASKSASIISLSTSAILKRPPTPTPAEQGHQLEEYQSVDCANTNGPRSRSKTLVVKLLYLSCMTDKQTPKACHSLSEKSSCGLRKVFLNSPCLA